VALCEVLVAAWLEADVVRVVSTRWQVVVAVETIRMACRAT